MSSSMDPKALINYYLRKGWYDHVQRLCETILEKKGNDPVIMFWRAFGIVLEKSFSSAIRELENLKKKKDVELACIHALIYTHNQCKNIDHDEIAQLELQLVMAEENASENSQLLCANFFWHIKEILKARKILDNLMGGGGRNGSGGNPETPIQLRATLLRGWIDLTVEPKTKREADNRENSIEYFERVKENKDCEYLLGVGKYFEMKKNYTKSLECLDEIIVKFPWFKQGLSEKALILLKMGNWDQSMDSIERALSDNPRDLEALRIMILYYLSREGKPKEAAQSIRDLYEALKKAEPSNPELYYDYSKCHARISDRNIEVLQCNLNLIEHAVQLSPDNGKYRAERGYQRSLMDDYQEAMESYKEALKMDESNEMALHGMIYCQIKLGQFEDASQQMEFLQVIQESLGPSASFVYLQALIGYEKEKDKTKQVKLLQKAVQIHMDLLKETISSNTTSTSTELSTHELMSQLNPLFLVEIATEFLKHDSNTSPSSSNNPQDSMVAKGTNILEKLVNKSPGFLRAQFILAQAYFSMGKMDDAYSVCNLLLKMEPSHSQAYLLQARISLEREHFKAASSCLEQALSHDFTIRNTLSYHIIKSKILENTGEIKEALQALQVAMKMVNATTTTTSSSSNTSGRKISTRPFTTTTSSSTTAMSSGGIDIFIFDKASVYIQMAQVLVQLNDIQEATKIVREALQIFKNTSQEVRVLVANSELAIKRGDFDAAIAMLSNVPTSSLAFMKAQIVKADIYLQHRKDKGLYARCFQDLVAMNPQNPIGYLNLAEAYLKIQLLDQAIEAFRSAAALTPNDLTIAVRIGKVLISKHDFLKAVDYYESALKASPQNAPLRRDLAELYTKLGHYDQALRVIQQAPSSFAHSKFETGEIHELEHAIALQLILPRIHQGLNDENRSIDALNKAYNLQMQLFERQTKEQPDVLQKQRRSMANTCFEIACIYAKRSNTEQEVLKYCEQALKCDETHEEAILFAARSFKKLNDLDQCQVKCSTLLRLNPSHEESATMLADIMLQKEEYDAAIYHFQTLLESKPDNFAALSRFIIMLRRAGKLEMVPRFLKLAERVGPRVAHCAGFHFCSGLYQRFKNNVREAIESLNLARRDPEWGEQALMLMIEIYLNPDNENIWESSTTENDGSAGSKEQTENIRIANTLLDELPSSNNSSMERKHRLKILEAYAVLAVKTKSMLEKSIQMFMEILEENRDHVAALLGLATAYMLTKQQPKARNQLKRIAKMPYDQALAEEFERSYLLLADIYVDRSKFDLAQELCKKALSHNKSSGKAWELLGLIMEKEQSYIDAAECYREAWKCEGEASASIGFKLAFNYLKAKKYVETVDVCAKVLDMYPDYPKIRKEILEKAFAGFRP